MRWKLNTFPLVFTLVVCAGVHAQDHWAFGPITDVGPPPVAGQWSRWVRNPIDAYVAERMKGARLAPSPEGDRYTLIRRVHLDLIGLPPAPEDADAFAADASPDAYERMVDRVLNSPAYGERWGRHWLDQARYADSHGYTADGARTMWPYRDWVIRAINADMPFDRFTIEQLAGDLLTGATTDQLIATGFHRNTLINQEGGTDAEQFRVESVVDRVNTTGTVWLGLTLACSQCHDHKFDPLSQEAYYRFYAFFNSTEDRNTVDPQVPTGSNGAGPKAMVMRELPEPRPTFVQIRGDFLRPGKRVTPGVPSVLSTFAPRGERADRLDLAHWLVHPSNPLVARVAVNRVWMRFFGRGLVETENDFGIQGTPPTHPALLDNLALELIRGGWSMKRLHKLIVTSATYRQSSFRRPEVVAADPLNIYLSRQNRVRVEAEVVRDAVLAASGVMTRSIGGPSVYPPQPDGVYAFTQIPKKWETATGADRYRRTMYTFFYRSAPYPLLTTFDAPDFQSTCTRRLRSNTPLQALTVANDTGIVELARLMAARVVRECAGDRERVVRIFRLCLTRPPTEKEIDRLLVYKELTARRFKGEPSGAAELGGGDVGLAPWVAVARVVINLDEFVTRE